MMKKITSFLLAAAVVCSAAPPQKLSADLASSVASNSGQSVQVIVQWKADAGGGILSKILALGGAVIADFTSIHSGAYSVPAAALNTLSADPDVNFVSLDRPVQRKALLSKAVGPAAATIYAPSVWAAGYVGTGVGVAIIDSGINPDDDLGTLLSSVVYSEDFTGLMPSLSLGKLAIPALGAGSDWYGHGQHIAGIIASNGKSSNCLNCTQSFTGIAPGVRLINLKVLDATGTGSDSSVIAAINRAITLKNLYNIRVINLSLGRPIYESYTQDPLCQAVEAAWKAGIVVVVSAGNEGRDNSSGNQGYGTIGAPGNDPYVLTVGAMRDMGTADRSDDLMASYSSKGPSAVDHVVKPDLVAPGNQIVALLNQHGTIALNNPQNIATLASYQNNAPAAGDIPTQPSYDPSSHTQPPAVKIGPGYSSQYYKMSGTSMAAGVVSGAVADLLQAAPYLTPDQVKMLLMQTASKTFPSSSTVTDTTTGQSYTSYYDIFTMGAGYLDLKAALALVNQVPKGLTALSPMASYDDANGDIELSFDPSSVFSNSTAGAGSSASTNQTLWGSSSTWSQSVLVGNTAMWDAGSVWAAASDSANKVMWGASTNSANKVMWGASTDSSNKVMWGASTDASNKVMWGASSTSAESTMINGEQ
jgi:serine protease AprX